MSNWTNTHENQSQVVKSYFVFCGTFFAVNDRYHQMLYIFPTDALLYLHCSLFLPFWQRLLFSQSVALYSTTLPVSVCYIFVNCSLNFLFHLVLNLQRVQSWSLLLIIDMETCMPTSWKEFLTYCAVIKRFFFKWFSSHPHVLFCLLAKKQNT